VLTLLSVVDQA
jgi:hypothetical protein